MALHLIRRFDAGPLISHELRYSYPLPTGCYEIDLKVFRRLHLTKWSRTSVQGPTEVHYHHSTTLPAQEDKSKSACEERKPLSDFTVAAGQALKWLTGAKQLILQIRIIFFRRDRWSEPLADCVRRPMNIENEATLRRISCQKPCRILPHKY